ncbi:MAG: tetratricopeptide repeat protein [Anaerolineae bacterium]|nr:tetratricopeptide repeat protein [Anaerolineae bacterium]
MRSWVKAQLLFTWGGLHRYFGNTNGVRHEYERAAHYFDRAYRADPNFDQALLAAAVLRYRELGRVDAAIDDLSGLLAANPAHSSARFYRAMAYQEAGRYQEALQDLQAFLDRAQPGDPNFDSALRMAGLLDDLVAPA